MNEQQNPAEQYAENLKKVNFEEVLQELEKSSIKLGRSEALSESYWVAVEELKIIKAELRRRLTANVVRYSDGGRQIIIND
jgi:hypothetical protein